MILVVLVQGGNQGGVGAAFGGGSSQGVFGATGATTLLGKLTYGAAGVFMVTSISLTYIQGKAANVGLSEKLKAASGETAPTPSTTTAPAGTTEAPKAQDGAASPTAPGPEATEFETTKPASGDAAAPAPEGGTK